MMLDCYFQSESLLLVVIILIIGTIYLMVIICSALGETPLHALSHLILNNLYGVGVTIPI